MGPDRPYLANYAMGLLFVMSMHMFFNAVTALLFPEVFSTGYIGGDLYLYFYLVIGILEFLMVLALLLGSGIAYKISMVLLLAMLAINVADLMVDRQLGFDIILQGILGAVAFVLLLVPSVRSYYNNWSLGDMPSMEI